MAKLKYRPPKRINFVAGLSDFGEILAKEEAAILMRSPEKSMSFMSVQSVSGQRWSRRK